MGLLAPVCASLAFQILSPIFVFLCFVNKRIIQYPADTKAFTHHHRLRRLKDDPATVKGNDLSSDLLTMSKPVQAQFFPGERNNPDKVLINFSNINTTSGIDKLPVPEVLAVAYFNTSSSSSQLEDIIPEINNSDSNSQEGRLIVPPSDVAVLSNSTASYLQDILPDSHLNSSQSGGWTFPATFTAVNANSSNASASIARDREADAGDWYGSDEDESASVDDQSNSLLNGSKSDSVDSVFNENETDDVTTKILGYALATAGALFFAAFIAAYYIRRRKKKAKRRNSENTDGSALLAMIQSQAVMQGRKQHAATDRESDKYGGVSIVWTDSIPRFDFKAENMSQSRGSQSSWNSVQTV